MFLGASLYSSQPEEETSHTNPNIFVFHIGYYHVFNSLPIALAMQMAGNPGYTYACDTDELKKIGISIVSFLVFLACLRIGYKRYYK